MKQYELEMTCGASYAAVNSWAELWSELEIDEQHPLSRRDWACNLQGHNVASCRSGKEFLAI